MFGVDIAPAPRRAPRKVVRADRVPVPAGQAVAPRPPGRGVGSDRDCPLRGLWGWFLDSLQPELHALRADCLAAEPGPEADEAYDRYHAHLKVMEWAAKEVDRQYLLDRMRVAVDWSWDRDPHPPQTRDEYEGDHTLGGTE